MKFEHQREEMVAKQIEARGVNDPNVLAAMRKVPRHLFVSEALMDQAYGDFPLPIGEQQTISQPYIVAEMTQALDLNKDNRVLEIGTGSGYQATVLSEFTHHVYAIEILEPLARATAKRLEELGHTIITTRIGDGYKGWPDNAPFDAIIVTAAPGHVPLPLKEQLKVGARLVIPVGEVYQELMVIARTSEGYVSERIIPVRFVPMTGEAEEKSRDE